MVDCNKSESARTLTQLFYLKVAKQFSPKKVDNEGIEIVALDVLPRPFGCSFLTTNNQQMRTKRSTTELIARQNRQRFVTFYLNPFFSTVD